MTAPLAQVPWGPWIGVYIVLTGLASGLTLAARFARPSDERAAAGVEWVAGWASLATLAVCTVILVADLRRPGRFFLMVTQFANPGSLMSWGAKIIALKIALLAVYLPLLRRRRDALAAGDVVLAGGATRALYAALPDALALVSFALAVYPAFLLSWTWSSPASHNAGSALVYLCSGALLGVAGVGLLAAVLPEARGAASQARARAVILRVLGAHAVALGFFVLSLRANTTRVVFDSLLHGAWSGVFWLLVGVTGLAVVSTVPAVASRARAIPAVTALISAIVSRYVIFAIR